MLNWRPSRRLRQVTVISGRNLHQPPGTAAILALLIPSGHPLNWQLIYLSEAASGAASYSNRQWMPLPFNGSGIVLDPQISNANKFIVCILAVDPSQCVDDDALRRPAVFSVGHEPTLVGSTALEQKNTISGEDSAQLSQNIAKIVKAAGSLELIAVHVVDLRELVHGIVSPGAGPPLPNSIVLELSDGQQYLYLSVESSSRLPTVRDPKSLPDASPVEVATPQWDVDGEPKENDDGPISQRADIRVSLPSEQQAAVPSQGLRSMFFSTFRSGANKVVGSATPAVAMPRVGGGMEGPVNPSADTGSSNSMGRSLSMSTLRGQITDMIALRQHISRLSRSCEDLRSRIECMMQDRTSADKERLLLAKAQSEVEETRRLADVMGRRVADAISGTESAEKATTVTAHALISTLQALQAAHKRVRAGWTSLEGEEGRGRLVVAVRELVGRRCLMVVQAGSIMRLGPAAVHVVHAMPPGGLLDTQLDSHWSGADVSIMPGDNNSKVARTPSTISLYDNSIVVRPRDAGRAVEGNNRPSAMYRQEMRLTLGGLGLNPAVWAHAFDPEGYEWDAAEDKAASVVLGIAATLVDKIAFYVDVPLRYPLRVRGSTSAVMDNYPPMGGWTADNDKGFGTASATDRKRRGVDPVEYPLYCQSNRDRPRFAVGVFLLNKNVIQLLQVHGISAEGPNQLLQNLHTLVAAAQTGLPPGSCDGSFWRG